MSAAASQRLAWTEASQCEQRQENDRNRTTAMRVNSSIFGCDRLRSLWQPLTHACESVSLPLPFLFSHWICRLIAGSFRFTCSTLCSTRRPA